MNERGDVSITGYAAAAAGATDIGVNGPTLFGGWHPLATDPRLSRAVGLLRLFGGWHPLATNSERAVVNEWGGHHDVKNLFTADSDIFVASGSLDSTATIQAAGRTRQCLATLFHMRPT